MTDPPPHQHLLKLLGIHWGQFPEMWELRQKKGRLASIAQSQSLILDGAYVHGLSGMTCVCPASAIVDTLNMQRLAEMRAELEDHYADAIDAMPLADHT